MISCDEVFDVLTRGPFPTGRPSDGVVEAHLNQCGDCQRLAEALRPAVELFEAVAPEESRTLPSYGGRLRSTTAPLPWEATLAEALPAVSQGELPRIIVPQRQSLWASFISGSCPVNLARFAAAALLGAVIVGAAYQAGLPQVQAFARRFFGAGADSEMAHAKGLVQTTVKGQPMFLSPDCLSLASRDPSAGESAGNGDRANAQQLARAGGAPMLYEYDASVCCSKCHSIDSGHKSLAFIRASAQVGQQCVLCHQEGKLAAH